MTFRRRQRLTLALLLSLLLHLTTLIAPGWVLPAAGEPDDSDSSIRIDATLSKASVAQKPPVRSAQPQKPKQKRRQTPLPVPTATAPPAVVAGAEQAEVPPPAPQTQEVKPESPGPDPAIPEPVLPVVEAPAESPLPRHGFIRFAVSRGEEGFVIGQSVQRWSHDNKTYTLKNVTETTGLAAIFKPVQVTQTSTGEIGEDGLRPSEFRTGKDGVAGDAATFDWSSMKLQLSGGNPHEVTLEKGAQDMLSMFYQLSAKYPWMPPRRNDVTVATGRKFERYTFDFLGQEMLSTARGEMRTAHLRTAAGIEAIDIWVALDLRSLPVKIRYTDRQGDSFDQVAEEIQFDGMQESGGKP